MNYRVVWEIDIEADDAIEAAMKAQEFQRAPNSTATVYSVICEDGTKTEIDLMEATNV